MKMRSKLNKRIFRLIVEKDLNFNVKLYNVPDKLKYIHIAINGSISLPYFDLFLKPFIKFQNAFLVSGG